MKITFLPPSPRAGEITHIENTAGRALVAAGLACEEQWSGFRERLAAEAMPAAQIGSAVWSVGTGQQSQVVEIKASCSTCRSQFRYQGHTEVRHVTNGPMIAHNTGRATTLIDPSKFTFQHTCGMWPEKIPVDIWKEYVRLKKKEVVSLVGADEAVMYRIATNNAGDNEHAPQQWFEMPSSEK
jgi:hypothetical protein